MWDFSCPDWYDRLLAGRVPMPDLPSLDKKLAARAVASFNKLHLPDVPGLPQLKDVGGEWQREIVRTIFGSLINGVRMVPELFLMVPKKNSKTTGGAALTLVAFLLNERPRAEFIYAGPTQEVADLAFQQTIGMIEADPTLKHLCSIQHHLKTITKDSTGAKLKIKTFDMKIVTGAKPVWVLLDELHLMSSIKNASRIIGQLRGGMLVNQEAVLVIITTQSDEPPAGAFKMELDYARGVRDGRIKNSRLLPILYEFPHSMQTDRNQPWRDTKNWPLVMPNLNRPITIAQLEQQFEAAREKGQDEERRWASQHLNVEIGMALIANAWPGARFWERREDPQITPEYLLTVCDVIVVGLDGGGLDDLFGLALVGRHKMTKEWLVWAHAWCHSSLLNERPQIAPRLTDFQREGDLTIVDDKLEDLSEIIGIIRRVKDNNKLGAVAVDPAGLGELVEALKNPDIDITEENELLIGVPQGYGMMNALKTGERKLVNGTMLHSKSAMMNWCVSNIRIEPTATAIRATKAFAGDKKIDPAMAMFDALQVMIKDPKPFVKPTYRLFAVA